MDCISLDISGSADKRQALNFLDEKDLLHIMSFLQRSEVISFFKACRLDQNKDAVYLNKIKATNFKKIRKMFMECSIERSIFKKLIQTNQNLAVKYSPEQSWNFTSALRHEVKRYGRVHDKNCGIFRFVLAFLSMNLFIMLGCLCYQITAMDRENDYAELLTKCSGIGVISSIFLIFYPVYKIMGNAIDTYDNLNDILEGFCYFKRRMAMKVNHFDDDLASSDDEKSSISLPNRRIM